jgi:membrane protein insertase Oxa1/YidC/SpoIIIJ
MQPKPQDPQMLAQYRMMTFMLVFFGFIFYKFPAGFMLYIMTRAALGIIESKIIKAELAHEEAKGNREAAGGGESGSPALLPAGGKLGGPGKRGKSRA